MAVASANVKPAWNCNRYVDSGRARAATAAGASRDWGALRAAVLESLRTFPPRPNGGAIVVAASGQADEPEPSHRDRQLELAYEALKAYLLREGALGRLPVDAMEEDLLRARRLRRLAESAIKARNRLAPWLGQVDGRLREGDALVEQTSASTPNETATKPPTRQRA